LETGNLPSFILFGAITAEGDGIYTASKLLSWVNGIFPIGCFSPKHIIFIGK
jgi:hypothetical protein